MQAYLMQAYFIAGECEFIVQPKRIHIVVVLTLPMPVRLERKETSTVFRAAFLNSYFDIS